MYKSQIKNLSDRILKKKEQLNQKNYALINNDFENLSKIIIDFTNKRKNAILME
jgi:hypothetical protein